MTTVKNTLENISSFIWNFKDYDNIRRNILGLEELFKTKKFYSQRWFYNKLVVMVTMSITEALLIDLIYRLKESTTHFPHPLSNQQINIKLGIKNNLCKRDGRLKNLSFTQIINFLNSHNILLLLGFEESILNDLNRLRNRIHINNYYKNHHKDENITFSDSTAKTSFQTMINLIKEMSLKLKRPW